MKAVTVKEISHELLNLTPKKLRDLCLRLSRFKKENKEPRFQRDRLRDTVPPLLRHSGYAKAKEAEVGEDPNQVLKFT
jgi:hypothetical protein